MYTSLTVVLVSFVSLVWSLSIVPIIYSPPDSCSTDTFYQSSNHSCVSCGTNQTPANDGMSCTCIEGYINNIGSSQCTPCSNSEVVNDDGLFCLSCNSISPFNNGNCEPCDITSIYVDTLPANQTLSGIRSCITCPMGTWADPSKTSCVPCGVSDCTTCTQSMIYGGVCFSSHLTTASRSFAYYDRYYASSRELCINGNGTACQLLVNLCVLSEYSQADAACQDSIELLTSQPHLLPPLYYPKFGAGEYLSDTVVNSKYSTIESAEDGMLTVTAAMYSLNGTFLGLSTITDEIMLCQDRVSRSSTAWRVGAQYEIKCTIDSEPLMSNGKEPMFFDLFLSDSISDGSSQLIPIPILVDNYKNEDGDLVNRGGKGRWQFVTRFYLSQSLTSSPLYASRMIMRVDLKSLGSVQVPYIRITYSDLPETTPTNIPASFSVLWRKGGDDFNIGIGVTVSIFVIVSVIYAGIKENGFIRRQGSSLCELQTILFAIVQFCSATSTFILMILAISCLFILILFKTQSAIFIVLPEGDQEIAFITLLVIAFVFRLITVVYLIWKQVTIQIFLIDWEKPKVHAHQDTPVSVWRSYFVANEWNEIQSLRKIRPIPVLLAVLLFQEVVGLIHLTERDPLSYITRTSDRYSSPYSSVLRFTVSVVLYLTFAVFLRVYMVLFHERFIEHKTRQFVDFCSISNVSVFILSHNLYGHYIHGRSVHGNADTDIQHMNENMNKEQENKCSRRGLIPDTDKQTFEIAISPKLRIRYNEILGPIIAERAEGRTNTAGINTNKESFVTEASLKAYKTMTEFLSGVIDHSLPDYDHVVKRKLFLEKVFKMEFHDASNRSILYEGKDDSYTDVLFYGNEWILLTFDILLFCTIDLVTNNIILSTVITYVSIKFLQFIRNTLGKRNLGNKTLVDNRFLI